MDSIKRAWGWVKAKVIGSLDRNGDNAIAWSEVTEALRGLEPLVPLAKEAAETVIGIDLSGDGRVRARNEILSIALSYGVPALAKRVEGLSLDLVDEGDLARLLAIARIAEEIACAGFGLPRFRFLELLFSVVFPAVAAGLQKTTANE
jgi:hypothetical protein